MNLFDALPIAVQNEFADRRDAIPRAYFYSANAAVELAQRLRAHVPSGRVHMLADTRTFHVCGQACQEALRAEGFELRSTILQDLPDGSSPVCDDTTREKLRPVLAGAAAVVGVGAGVVNDLSKWLAADLAIPYAILATAASMNGYCAANVAPTMAGLKTLFRAKAPICVAAIPEVVQNAPFELTASGLGDVIAKPVSTADWMVNNLLFGETYSDAVASIIDQVEPKYTTNPEKIAQRDPDAIRALFDALVLSGCAMTLQGSSLPASGGEHLISHTLDMMAHVDQQRHDLHGRQVGVATIFAAALYEAFFALASPSFRVPDLPFHPEPWKDIAPAIEAEHVKKLERLREATHRLSDVGMLGALRERLAPQLRSPATVKACLQRAGAAHRLSDIGCSRERFLTAVFRASSIRARFTSLDLALVSGVLQAQAENIVDRYL